ncbi:hypothetical protein C0Q70_04035 [Pomacea canaliculata]|uniref:Uncharacterized protein n=1 Tax=Pomacea canaliculata TaxID=400727 RepID=A0A2T7PUE3_POMCA|nr:hypothetical protein C0Q70_04035 [Pomacea canaliculata]
MCALELQCSNSPDDYIRERESYMAESERNSLLPSALQSAVPQRHQQYSSFDNQGLWLEEEAQTTEEAKSVATDVEKDDEDEVHMNESESAVVDTENFRDKLSGPEIVFRLKFAHIYGSLDWPSHIRRLDAESREEVHRNVLDTLREQPIDIRQKISLSCYLRESLDGTTAADSSRNPNRTKKKKHRLHIPIRDGLWKEQITKISAYFGSHVASYFVFLRYLVYMDFFLLVVVLAFVTLPQIISGEDAAPRRLEGDFGVLSTSVMFYGAYSNTVWGEYDRPLAYFITWLVVNAVCFLALVGSMYIRYTRSKQAETSRDEFPYCWRLFSSWDYTLTKPDGASLHTTAIVTDTKERIRDDHLKQRGYFRQALRLATVRVLVNILVLVMLAVSGYLIYVVAASPDPDLYLPDVINRTLATYKVSH